MKKYGKAPATADAHDLRFAAYRAKTLPKRPDEFGAEGGIVPQMLGNDKWGDCVWAGAAHETMLVNATHNRVVEFDDAAVLSDYAAVTGFAFSDATDRGTNVRKAMSYRRKVGVVDALGRRHKLLAYLAIEPGHWEHLLEALWIFKAVGIGFEVPSSAEAQFDARKVWDVQTGASTEGGHYVPLVAYRFHELTCVTWGKLQRMTRRFFERYCDEAWVPLTTELLDYQGHSPEGFHLDELRADLLAVTR